VPTYEYECKRCSRTFEARQRISEDPLTDCPHCGGGVQRLIAPAPFILKGEGWYVTDYPSEGRKKALAEEKGTSGVEKEKTPTPTPSEKS
jgi:putative FmdB family regulatory protein